MNILITGAAGFIGSNFARLAQQAGHEVVLLDNFSRPRSKDTSLQLKSELGLMVHEIDLRNYEQVKALVFSNKELSAIWHLAGQVSYQSSIDDPMNDFTSNALGTLNMLEAARNLPNLSSFVFSSSNKVYGDLSEVPFSVDDKRFSSELFPLGFKEDLPIKPAGPYGISKFSAELLCQEYAELYGIPAVVFRQSSIAGPRQLATDDQGWVAYFAEKFALNESYYFTGQGLQVRDILHVKDLFELYMLASNSHNGFETFNVGGGIENSLSILELRDLLSSLTGNSPMFETKQLRSKDQLFFVSNNEKVEAQFGWHPKILKSKIIEEMVTWFYSKENIK